MKITPKRTYDGRSNHPSYQTYRSMLQRCYDPDHDSYEDYGGKGIEVDAEWAADFWRFVADMGERPEGLTLDRIDPHGPYSRENCRWLDVVGQANNRTTTRILRFAGLELSVTEWAEVLGQKRTTVRDRLKRGWSVAEAICRPVQ